MFSRFNRIISSFLIVILLTISFSLVFPVDAYANTISNLISESSSSLQEVYKSLTPPDIISNLFEYKKSLLKVIEQLPNSEKSFEWAINFLNASPQKICLAYWEMRSGTNSSQWDVLLKGAEAAFIIGQAIITVSAAGAGSLTGYAAMSVAVSGLQLGGIVTATAALLGSNAVGAAATAVVTSAVGGPILMAVVLFSIVVSGAFGANYLAWVVATQLGDWATSYCHYPF